MKSCDLRARRRVNTTSVSTENPPCSLKEHIPLMNINPSGYLHGAYFEGRDIALAVSDCVKGGGCVGLKHIDKSQECETLPYLMLLGSGWSLLSPNPVFSLV